MLFQPEWVADTYFIPQSECLLGHILSLLLHLHFSCLTFHAVSEERCDEVESLVFDLFANLGATGAINILWKLLCHHLLDFFFFELSLTLFK